MNYNEQESTIIDYLNGHLSQQDSALFERALNTDPELKARYESAKQLHTMMRVQSAENVTPSFETFNAKLESKQGRRFSWVTWAATPAALGFVVVLSMFNQHSNVNEFETLTSEVRSYDVSALRLVATPDSDILLLVKEYNLDVLSHYPNAKAVDIAVSGSVNDMRSKLAQDNRFLLVKAINE